MSNIDFRSYSAAFHYSNDDICHFGILGMKWGVRRYQNPDGTLTDDGRKRYREVIDNTFGNKSFNKAAKKLSREIPSIKNVSRDIREIATKYATSLDRMHYIEEDFYNDKKEFDQACTYLAEKKHKANPDLSIKKLKEGYKQYDLFQDDEILTWFKSGKSKYGNQYLKAIKDATKYYDDYEKQVKKIIKDINIDVDTSDGYSLDRWKFKRLLQTMNSDLFRYH